MIPGTPYLLLGAFLGGLGAGGYGVHTWYQAKRVNALEAARTVERAGVRTANQADIRYIDRLHEQKGIADARADKFQKAFTLAADSLRRCAVSPELVGLLNESREKPAAGVAAKPESAPSDAQAGSSDCAAVVETYQWNIDNVIVPNQIQIQELQRFIGSCGSGLTVDSADMLPVVRPNRVGFGASPAALEMPVCGNPTACRT